MPTVEQTLRPLSFAQYEQVVRLRLVPNLGHVRLQSLSGGHINAAYGQLEREASHRRPGVWLTRSCTALFAMQPGGVESPATRRRTLRHTAATLALTNGVPVHIVAARLGDDPTAVLPTYAHLLPQSDELAAERVAAAIS